MSDTDIIDQIDALVDEQLANYNNRSGYDHNINQERCRCGRDWHGLPITQRIDSMRWCGEFDPDYVFAEDDSPVMCVGSNTPGPWRQIGMWQLPDSPLLQWLDTEAMAVRSQRAVSSYMDRLRERMDSDYRMPAPPNRSGVNFAEGGVVSISSSNGWTQIGTIDRIDPSPILGEAVVSIRAHMTAFSESITAAMESMSATFSGIASHLELEPDTRTPQQRALPRPSTTPPMWANDVTRSRRPRRNRNQPNRQGIA
ncbi:hypothetical protein CH249_25790 [Rhodococcus sp. 05-2255-3B1]|uniref:hypothetical protein n=1 Tax=Rhodococcus sp. 05-2255-3B1 TaxID=2022482 RepID=UPI000B9B192B|nr:hypothetical protein [Rhodococcus sp. 05-2255-3B1]OZE04349.1 hypothetical protein CH249_25790 [Rhodococcus sp. 05-2255-3B1]